MLSRYSDFPWGAVIATAGFTTLFLDRILIRSRPSPGTMLNEDAPAIYPHVLLMMLSIHAIVEGIALGLEAHVAGAMAMFIGIVLHKGPAAFALILSLHVGGVERSRQKVSLVLFGIMTPIGILVGLLSSVLLASTTDVYVMLQGGFSVYAAGTFIYIAAIDIIDRELSTDQTRIARYSGGAVVAADAASKPTSHPWDRLIKFMLIVLAIVFYAVIHQWSHGTHTHGSDSSGGVEVCAPSDADTCTYAVLPTCLNDEVCETDVNRANTRQGVGFEPTLQSTQRM